MQTVCCVCQKTKSQNGWKQERASKESRVSHGYCPDCFHSTMERAQGWLQAKSDGNRGMTARR